MFCVSPKDREAIVVVGVPVEIDRSPRGSLAPVDGDVPGIRVLFIYPTYRNMLSPAIGLLAAVLVERGHEVQLFDTAYYAATYGHGESMDAAGRLMEGHNQPPGAASSSFEPGREIGNEGVGGSRKIGGLADRFGKDETGEMGCDRRIG